MRHPWFSQKSLKEKDNYVHIPKIIAQSKEQDFLREQRTFLEKLFIENEFDGQMDFTPLLRPFFTMKDIVFFMRILDENQEDKLILADQMKRPDFITKIPFFIDNSSNQVFVDPINEKSSFYERFFTIPVTNLLKLLKYEVMKFFTFKKANNTKDFPNIFIQNLKVLSRNFTNLKTEENSQQNFPDLSSEKDNKSNENKTQNNDNIGMKIFNKVTFGSRITRLFTSNVSSKSNDEEKDKSEKVTEVDSLVYFSIKAQIHLFYLYCFHSLSNQRKITNIYSFLYKLPLPDSLRIEFWKKILEVEFDPAFLFAFLSLDNNIYPNKTKLFSQIESDIPRCHQYHPYFNTYEGKLKLYDLMISVMNFDKNINYIQGLDAMGAVVLEATRFQIDLSCFLMGKIIDKTITNFINPNDEKNYVKEYLLMFQWLLFFVEPLLAKHLMEIGFLPELYAISWILNLFSSRLIFFFFFKSIFFPSSDFPLR